jgi:aldehyde dehydrogenase (NAD+)
MSDVTTTGDEERLLVDGELRPARSGRVFETVNPATGEVLGVAADAGPEDMEDAIGAARRAFDTTDWSTDLELRVRCLRQLRQAFERHGDAIRAMTIAETGSPLFMTHTAQLDAPVESLGWVADLAEGYQWETDLGVAEPMGIPSHRWVRREATGVVGAITPWNVPHQINLAKLGPALAAGNTVVLKPAPDTPWCATVLGRLVAEETDIPAGVVNIVPSADHALGALLSTDRRVDQVSFTGSTATGRKVMASAADSVKKVFLELGGKSAFVVLDDADLRGACATAAFTVCTHAGQGCAITTRLLVPRALFDDAVVSMTKVMGRLAAGDPTDPGTICGPLISARQRDRVEGYLRLAVEEGGSFALGGGRPEGLGDGFFVEPTLIVGLGNDARVAQEEIFGPVMVVIPHDGDDDAVGLANDSSYGLSGSVWSADRDRAVAVANRIRTGTIGINGGLWFSPDVPFGGYRQSGVGRESGVAGFEEYLETKSLAEPA